MGRLIQFFCWRTGTNYTNGGNTKGYEKMILSLNGSNIHCKGEFEAFDIFYVFSD